MGSTRPTFFHTSYDALGRRVERNLGFGRERTKFTYDGEDVLLDDANGTQTKYLNGPGIDNKLSLKTGSAVSYFLTDHLGSTNALTDSNGAITSQASYDGFGNQTGSLTTRYGFTGRERDDFTGLMHYRARHYDPKLGRFTSEDPIGFGGGDVNLYGYVRNQPYIFRDPMGLYPGVDVMANPNIWGPAAASLAAAGGAILSAAGAAASSPVVVAGAGLAIGAGIGYYPGQWTANHPSNPFVNGPWNPWGTPAPMLPPFPITPPNSSPASRPYCQPAPRAVPYPNWPADKYPIPLGPYPPQTPEKQEECFNKCAHLLGVGKGAEYVTCYRRCMGTID